MKTIKAYLPGAEVLLHGVFPGRIISIIFSSATCNYIQYSVSWMDESGQRFEDNFEEFEITQDETEPVTMGFVDRSKHA